MWFLKYSKEAHRHACLTLYKTLLTHAAHLPLSERSCNTAALIIRRKFRQSLNLQGRPLRSALQSAHEDEKHMRQACLHDPASLAAITTRLSSLVSHHSSLVAATHSPKHIIVSPPPPPNQFTPKRKHKLLALSRKPYQKARHSAWVRAHPPVMGATNNLPVLKWPGRKTPAWVSSVLNDKLKRRVRQIDALNELKGRGMYYSEYEDSWDRQLEHLGVTDDDPDNYNRRDRVWATWRGGAEMSLRAMKAHHYANEQRTYALTCAFQRIISNRTALWHERTRERRIRRWQRRRELLTKRMEEKLTGLIREWKVTKEPHRLDD